MLANTFVDNAKVMAKGQVTIPKDIRKVLGVASGDRITFVVEGNSFGLFCQRPRTQGVAAYLFSILLQQKIPAYGGEGGYHQ